MVVVFFRGLGGLKFGGQEAKDTGHQERAHGYQGAAAPNGRPQADKHQDAQKGLFLAVIRVYAPHS
jgi:hypothetical protein